MIEACISFGSFPSQLSPIDFATPKISEVIALISPPVNPGPFCLATVIACSKVISAATTVPASPDPFSKSRICLISDEAGGVPISMVNPFLSSILILTGLAFRPFL